MTTIDDTVAELGTILSVWAHPDDETYLAGGLMSAAARRGQRVVCVSASAGERGTSDPGTWPPERLGAERRLEAAAAMTVLGVREHAVLRLPDGSLGAHTEHGLQIVERLFTTIRPDTVLTFGPEGRTFHPDHIAVHRWVTTVWRRLGCKERLLYASPTDDHLTRFGHLLEAWEVYMTDERPDGVAAEDVAVHVQLDGIALQRKLAALQAMPTQTAGLLAGLGDEVYAALSADEAFVAAA